MSDKIDEFSGRRLWVKTVRATGDTTSLLRRWRYMRLKDKRVWQERAEQLATK